MIDTEAAARDAVQRWLDADDPGRYRVTALLDLGPLWRVMWAGVTDAALSVQQSRDNVWVRLAFTVNVRVVSNAEWAAHIAKTGGKKNPDPNTDEGVGWWDRLGRLTPERKDRWWTVWGGFPTDDVARDLVRAIRDYGLPAIHERIKAPS